MATSRVLRIGSTIKLNDGNTMPYFGLGTYKSKGDATIRATETALKHGYKMFDTAQIYRNEQQVGQAIKNSKVNRKDFYVVTKLWTHGKDKCLSEFGESLKRLDMDYVDLFLIHIPDGGHILETYDAMIKLREQGLVKSVGVSNFNVEHLEGLRKAGRITPAVNQIEIHMFWQRKEVVDYCHQHGIVVMGYAPLAKACMMDYQPLLDMAKRYEKSAGQLMIRWSLQRGFVTIPKSDDPERIVENAGVFDWEIGEEDMRIIASFPSKRVGYPWKPTEAPWEG